MAVRRTGRTSRAVFVPWSILVGWNRHCVTRASSTLNAISVPAVLRLESAAIMTTVIREGYAAFTALIADIAQLKQDAAWQDVEQALKRFEENDGFAGPIDMNLVIGRKPSG